MTEYRMIPVTPYNQETVGSLLRTGTSTKHIQHDCKEVKIAIGDNGETVILWPPHLYQVVKTFKDEGAK